jgi:hypothetical protein
MDPLSIIVTALSVGAATGAKETVSEAIKDSYHGLKSLVKRKLANKPEAEMVLAKHEEKPEVWEAPLKQALIEVGAERDGEIIEASRNLLTLINPQQAATGKYNVQITGDVQGFVQGDNAQVKMSFGDKRRSNKPPED